LGKPKPPPTTRSMSDFLKARFGPESAAYAYYDESERHVVAVVEAVGVPHPELTTFSTASLHAAPNMLEAREIRVELLIVGRRDRPSLANVVATAAFYVMKDGWLAAPGVVFPNAISEYIPDVTVPHLMWTEPFDFGDLGTVEVPDLSADVHVLQGVPITEAEREFVLREGFDALSDALVSADAEHFDLQRASVA
jgi:antitoxin YqcF